MRSAAILAGGRASRFGGRDKSALVVDGETILRRQVSELRQVRGLSGILIVGREDANRGAAADSGIRTISDLVPGSGPLGGIHAALSEAGGDDRPAVMILACDMPYVTAPLVSWLLDLSDDADAVVPHTERGYHPLCAVYTRACLGAIDLHLAERRLKVVDLFDEIRTRVVTSEELDRFGDHHRLMRNVNTPADYAALDAFPSHQL